MDFKLHLNEQQRDTLRLYSKWAEEAACNPALTKDTRQKLLDRASDLRMLANIDMTHQHGIKAKIQKAF